MPPDIETIKNDMHSLSLQFAGLQPMVQDVHSQMPKIADALETLAMVTAKLENNTEEHKRIHFRINDVEGSVNKLNESHEHLKTRFDKLDNEHTVCITTGRVERRMTDASWWGKAKTKALDKAVELITLVIIGFTAYMILVHLAQYPATARFFVTQPAAQQPSTTITVK